MHSSIIVMDPGSKLGVGYQIVDMSHKLEGDTYGTLNQWLQNALLKQQALSLDFVLPSDRYQSPYWRAFAATHIQVAWRYRQKCLKHSRTSQSIHITSLSNYSFFSRV